MARLSRKCEGIEIEMCNKSADDYFIWLFVGVFQENYRASFIRGLKLYQGFVRDSARIYQYVFRIGTHKS